MVPKPPTSITNFLSTPARVAQSLDWRKTSGSVLSMRITKNRIDLALASHPSFQEPIVKLPSIPLARTVVDNKKVIESKVANELSRTIQQHHVCGMVVDWPVNQDGWCGEECGITLNVLDQLASEKVFQNSRPICLLDEHNFTPEIDEWGRSPVYSRCPTVTEEASSFSSKAKTSELDGDVILNVWNKFCETNWPQLPRNEKPFQRRDYCFSSIDELFFDQFSKRHATAASGF